MYAAGVTLGSHTPRCTGSLLLRQFNHLNMSKFQWIQPGLVLYDVRVRIHIKHTLIKSNIQTDISENLITIHICYLWIYKMYACNKTAGLPRQYLLFDFIFFCLKIHINPICVVLNQSDLCSITAHSNCCAFNFECVAAIFALACFACLSSHSRCFAIKLTYIELVFVNSDLDELSS